MTTDGSGKVLIVDDDKKLSFILSSRFQAEGYEVAVADDGVEGIVLARSFRPDVIVMDINLPRMNGIEATRHLKQDPRTMRIPVIMLTARSRTEDVVIGLETGAEEYVVKPFEVVELLARVRTVMRVAGNQRDLEQVNERLTDVVADKMQQLELLYEYARSLNEADSPDEIYDLIMATVQRLTGGRRVSLMLREPGGEYLRCVRAVGVDPGLVKEVRISSMEGITGRVLSSGKTFAAQTYGETAEQETRKPYDGEWFLSTPLMSNSSNARKDVIGVLNVTDREDEKPFSPDEIDCVRSIADAGTIALRQLEQRNHLRQSVQVLLRTVGQLAEYRDEETGNHLDRVSRYSRILATELAGQPGYEQVITPQFVEDLCLAAPMHDIGKVGVADEILTKPGKLTDEEFEIMKTHTEIGRRTLEVALPDAGSAPILQMCIDIAYCHHEKCDGSGYPRGISGDDIPLPARILALVDAYDAITSRRRYSEPRSHEQAVEIIRSESGRHFDPDVVKAFLECGDEFDAVRQTHGEPAAEPLALELTVA